MLVNRGVIFTFIAICAVLFSGFSSPEAMAQKRVKISSLTVVIDDEICFVHTVRRRQTLYSIAQAYGVSQNAILAKNPKAESGIKNGQTLLIPSPTPKKEDDPITTEARGKDTNAKDRKYSEQQTDYIKPSSAKQVLLPVVGEVIDTTSYQYERPVAVVDTSLYGDSKVLFGLTRSVDDYAPLKVVMLLPFGASFVADENFAEFYRGALVGFEQLAGRGADINLEVISTARSVERVRQIVESGALSDANLIIGPIYGEEFEIVAPYAAHNRIPIVSPLGSVGRADNAFVIEVAPTDYSRWDKVAAMLGDGGSNVIVVEHQSLMDSAIMQQLALFIPPTAHRVQYVDKMTDVLLLKDVLVRGRNNIIVVPISNEIAVEEILARYSSIKAAYNYDITVVGAPRWSRFERLNVDLFFKLSVLYPTTYFFDRYDTLVGEFYNQYLSRFSNFPSLYTFRGYDVAKIFGSLLFGHRENMMFELIKDTPTAMQTPYLFDQSSDTTKIVNIDWPLVQYLPDYTIVVK